jgi:streptogramin lyase
MGTKVGATKRPHVFTLALAAVLVGCASDDSQTAETLQSATPLPTITSAPATSAASPDIQAVTEIDGGQLLGLAIDEESVWPISFDAGTISKVDPESNEVTTAIDLGSGAASALAVDGVVWVAGYGGADSPLFEIDAASATLTATHRVGSELCCDLSSGDGSLWAVDPGGSAIEVDLATGETVQTIPIVVDRNAHINAVYADGYLWFSSDTTALSRLDPDSGVIDEFDVGGGVPFLARDGLVWGASPTEVWAVDKTGAVVERLELTNSIEVISLELSGPDVWVGIRHGARVGAVQQVDRATGEVRHEVDVDIPARMVVGFGSLWVTDSGSNKLYRIGPIA